jgi:hypothetical protein
MNTYTPAFASLLLTGGTLGPYNFDFLTVTATAKEREIERGLLNHLCDLLLELGRGFSFVGSQVPGGIASARASSSAHFTPCTREHCGFDIGEPRLHQRYLARLLAGCHDERRLVLEHVARFPFQSPSQWCAG